MLYPQVDWYLQWRVHEPNNLIVNLLEPILWLDAHVYALHSTHTKYLVIIEKHLQNNRSLSKFRITNEFLLSSPQVVAIINTNKNNLFVSSSGRTI